jgi:hypothetical protein
MKEIKGYLANQFGFSETGRYILDTLIKPRITAMGIKIYDPFVECGKTLDFAYLLKLKRLDKVMDYWKGFSEQVAPINNRLMHLSDCQLAILDGGPAVDDGVASEIGYFAGIKRGPIFALRSDFRCGENIAVSINPQILGYILLSKGYLAEGSNALEKWFAQIKAWKDAFTQGIV